MDNTVIALQVHGGDLYAGGAFLHAGETPANFIARWDGVAWNALGTGTDQYVFALEEFADRLLVGGTFTQASNDVKSALGSTESIFFEPLKGVVGRDIFREKGLDVPGYPRDEAAGRGVKKPVVKGMNLFPMMVEGRSQRA
jgi:hypothetical protein